MARVRWVVALFCALSLSATGQTVRWQRALGGSAAEQWNAVIELSAQTVLVAGSTRSIDDELKHRTSLDTDGWLARLNLQGDVVWQQTYGSTYNDEFYSVVALPDGGYVAVGYTDSPTLSHGGRDAWVVRTDALGKLRWQRAYGGKGTDIVRAVQALPDGSLLLAGESASPELFEGKHAGGADVWVLRLDARGSVLWQRSYGGSSNEAAYALLAVGDGTFMIAGGTESSGGLMPPSRGKTDALLMQIVDDGSLRWRRTFGGSSFDEFYGVVNHQGGFVAAGTTQSRDGDVRGHRGNGDVWLVATDASGFLRWTSCYGGTGDEGANGIATTRSGDLLVAATARSRDGQRNVFRGVFDGWLLRLSPQGMLRWQKSIGGFQNDAFAACLETVTGMALAVGHTSSTDYDLAEVQTHGSLDAWVALVADPDLPIPVAEPLPTLVTGYVTDAGTGQRLAADVTLVDFSTMKPIRNVRTDTATALYQHQLTRSTSLGLSVLAPGYLLENIPLRLIPDQIGTQVRLDIALVPIRADTSINLHHIYFETGQAKLKSESSLELQKLLQFLRDNPSLTIRIVGHTDASSGDPVARTQLSRYRALEVKAYLQERGITGPRMDAIGVGSDRPIADERDERGRALNRRVEIVITAAPK
jgi:outer membrane protein OmpA-like peptidoglycan-associated protein